MYQREPHARQMAFRHVAQPVTYEERVALARRTLAELKLDVEVWVDDLGDASRAAFGDVPNPAIVIDAKGIVRMKLSWSDPEVLGRFLPEVLPKASVERPALAADGFLDLVAAEPPKADASPIERARVRHHRHVMLGHLVVALPKHAARKRWLTELSGKGVPSQQRAWVDRLRQAAASEKPARRK